MGLKNSQYQTIMREYEQKQVRARDTLSKHYTEVYTRLPQLKSMDESISILSVQYGKRLLGGDDSAIASLKKELAILRKNKEDLMESAGFPADYLELSYECPKCKDTGYIGNQKCRCFKRAVSRLLYEQSNLKEVLQKENFDTFSFCYYSDNFIDSKSDRSSLAIMKAAFATCQDFVRTFEQQHRNLFLYGDVGVGKTFLSNCIAKELMDAGFSVIYYSAPSFFNMLAKSTFHKNDEDAQTVYDYIFDCDLLIIDDLGTEFTNSFVTSQLFTCINERLLGKKSTVISTNLSLDSLADLYTERSFSRITSNYILLRLIGDDIRIKKKLMNKEGL